MALRTSWPSANGLTTHAHARRDLEGAVVRNSAGKMRPGVFPAHHNPLFARRNDMRLDIPDFRAVQDKGGPAWIAGEGATTTPAFGAAPAANKRIDLLYLTQELPGIDPTTEVGFFVEPGVASPSPSLPALPAARADAIPWLSVEIPAGATSMQSAGVIIKELYPYTAMAGGTVVVRDLIELAAWTPSDGARAYCVADTTEYVRRGTVWVGPSTVANLVSAALASNSWTVLSNPASWSIDAAMRESPWANGIVVPAAGLYRVEGSIRVMAGLPVVYAAKLNNTAASNAGLVVAANTPGVASEALASFSRTMRFSANDVITPAAYTSGTAGPYGITASGTGFSVTRV